MIMYAQHENGSKMNFTHGKHLMIMLMCLLNNQLISKTLHSLCISKESLIPEHKKGTSRSSHGTFMAGMVELADYLDW